VLVPCTAAHFEDLEIGAGFETTRPVFEVFETEVLAGTRIAYVPGVFCTHPLIPAIIRLLTTFNDIGKALDPQGLLRGHDRYYPVCDFLTFAPQSSDFGNGFGAAPSEAIQLASTIG
jgi:hypothetical protein